MLASAALAVLASQTTPTNSTGFLKSVPASVTLAAVLQCLIMQAVLHLACVRAAQCQGPEAQTT